MPVKPAVLLVAAAVAAQGQQFTQRGFFENRNFLYFQDAPNDSANYVGEAMVRWEGAYQPVKWFKMNASFDGRVDTHRQFEREWRLDFRDRDLLRPAFSARRYSLTLTKGGWTFEGGRQFIRWGKADILNPTDRFAPKDFLNVFNTEFLGVIATRLTYERGSETLDFVYQPVFTPSRSPLLNQRWVVLPSDSTQVKILDQGFRFPGRGNAGLRWNHLGSGYEMSLSFYDGYNHLPLLDARLVPALPPAALFQRYFAQMRMYGGDAAVPLRWFTLKGEAAYFTSNTPQADEYVQYVIQAERQSGEWSFVGGYAGEYVTERRNPADFAPDRGITKTFLGRASYNIDANRSVAFESAVRQTGDGYYGKAEYSQAFGQHWRLTAALTLIGGEDGNFLGQYRRNKNVLVALRYSF